ncbi:g10121 [Coccomyxa viridis]|uniref:G10121 protein n=1 Tax=Coccomyxa viridis TaxID=1274662 RepID=A0ABP1G4J8_9CHLO
MLLFPDGTAVSASSPPAVSTGSGSYDNELWEPAGSWPDSSPSQTSSSETPRGRSSGRLSFSPSDSSSHAVSRQTARDNIRSAQGLPSTSAAHEPPEAAGQPTGLVCSEEASSSPQQSSSDGPRLMEVELLCLNESLSDSGSPPSIYFNSLFMPDALQDSMVSASAVKTPAPYLIDPWAVGMTYPDVIVAVGQGVEFKWPALPVQGAGTCLLLTLYSHSKLHGKLVLIMCVYVQLSGDYTTSPLKAGTYYFACQVPGHW